MHDELSKFMDKVCDMTKVDNIEMKDPETVDHKHIVVKKSFDKEYYTIGSPYNVRLKSHPASQLLRDKKRIWVTGILTYVSDDELSFVLIEPAVAKDLSVSPMKTTNICLSIDNVDKYDICIDIGDFKNYEEYDIFLKNQISDSGFGQLVMKNIIDVEKLKPNDPYPESVLDFSNNKFGELKINLVKNKTLEKERLEIEKNQNNKYIFKNIFMIYSDATSRVHFQRSFPKLSNFIKRFLPYNLDNKMRSYQFNKYHSFEKATHFNIVPMFYGNSFHSHKGIHSVKFFKENGFITGHVVDRCSKEQYNIVHKKNSMDENDEREYEEWDHENVAYLCDNNFRNMVANNFYGITSIQGSFSSLEKCLYGKTISEHMINYATQFWEKYENNRKYFRIAFNYGHEKTGAVIKYLDEPLFNMLQGFYKKGLLKDTAVFIVSDHGNQNDGVYNIMNSGEWELEKRYPFFVLLLWNNNEFKKSEYDTNLLKNQDIMVTSYDIHDTMIHIIYGDKNSLVMSKDGDKRGYSANNKGASMFKSVIGKDRNCEKYKDDWSNIKFCKCSK